MDQQQGPEDLDLGYGDDDDDYLDLSTSTSSPQHLQPDSSSPPLSSRRVQSAEGSNSNSDQLDITSSYGDDYTGTSGDDYTGSDDSYYDDSFTSWEDGMLTAQNASPKPKKKKVAARQQKRVYRARIFMLVLLGITAVSISLMAYYVAREKERQDYRDHYNVLAARIEEATEENFHTTFTAMNTFSNSLLTRVMDDSDEDWPMVTFQNFESLAKELQNNSGIVQVVFVPLVNETLRQAWEVYSVQNQGWVHGTFSPEGGRRLPSFDDDLEQEEYPRYFQSEPYTQQRQSDRRQHVDDGIVHDDEIPSQMHPPVPREERSAAEHVGHWYAPAWQMYPIPTQLDFINSDLLQEPSFQSLARIVQETRQAGLSKHLLDDLTKLFFEQSGESIYQERPSNLMVQPIWKSYEFDSDLAGFALAWIPWDAFLEDTLRDERDERIFATILSSCQPQYSLHYAIEGGQEVNYLGQGVENQFADFDEKTARSMTFPTQSSDLLTDDAPEAVPLERRQLQEQGQGSFSNVWPECHVQLNLYASDELAHTYITMYPIYYVIGVVCGFVFLAFAFLVYDAVVERRQYRVMDMAENTGRILSSLFPTQFADKLLAEKKEKEKEAKKEKRREKKRSKEFNKLEQAPNKQLKKFMNTNKKGKDADVASTPKTSDNTDDADDSPLFLAKSKPIADLFPDTTVLFSDIAGFTAWSSVREPSQVFILLESIYQAFDFLAKQYGIFKIETIGDCYVAVCGLPDPREDHAVAMSRFSMACMTKMKNLVNQLELTLGPDTGDLTMRFGLHSGPVTAGVLRGERARFQLFGETVNIAARMESSGVRDKIQISQETRNKLAEAGKLHWFVKRDDVVKMKEQEMQTYFLVLSQGNQRRMSMAGAERRMTLGPGGMGGGRRASMGGGRRMSLGGPQRPNRYLQKEISEPPLQAPIPQKPERNIYSRLDSADSDSDPSDDSDFEKPEKLEKPEPKMLMMPTNISKKQQRLIDWNCESLQQILRQIVAVRNSSKGVPKRMQLPGVSMPKLGAISIMKLNDAKPADPVPLDEFVDAINMSEMNAAAYHASMDAWSITLDPAVVSQLRTYVAILASKYRDNEFHNFEHASHCAMSTSIFLTRIVPPDILSINDKPDTDDEDSDSSIGDSERNSEDGHAMRTLHDYTLGILDPLTKFSVVLSALMHDVDHRGCDNEALIKEEPTMAAKYQNRSVAEQNSIDVGWDLLMHDTFELLRDTICGNPAELKRFRQLIVQTVLATDLFDAEMSKLRNARWKKVFGSEGENGKTDSGGPKRTSLMNFRTVDTRNETNRKATIVLEYLAQASDVSHSMQHWHIYQKWNKQLFMEMYSAYKKGRTNKDPSEGWYTSELQFFDTYVIPMAMKMKECGVFGASSDEYLNYATANRKEWELKGESIVTSLIDQCKSV